MHEDDGRLRTGRARGATTRTKLGHAGAGAVGWELALGVAGLAVGLVAGWWLASASDGGASPDGASRDVVRASDVSTDRTDAADLAGPAATTDEPVAATSDGPGRRTITETTSGRDPSIDLDALVAEHPLLGELSKVLGSDALVAAVAADEEEAARFLMHLYLGMGDLDAALDLARRTSPSPGTWSQLAQSLDGAGRDQEAADAFLAAIDGAGRFAWVEPMAGWARRLAELDPERGLALLRDKAGAVGSDSSDMRLSIAKSLAATGSSDEAREALLELVAENGQLSEALDELAKLDPELAEAKLREKLATGRFEWLHGQLARLLFSNGDREGALAAIDAGFTGNPDQASELLMIALQNGGDGIDDARLHGWIESSGGDSYLLAQVGESLLQNGQDERALSYFEETWTKQSTKDGYLSYLPDALIEKNPDAVRGMLEQAWNSAGDRDEVWGDIADHYWRIGEKALAEEAWRRANQLDPNDGEWTGKIAQLEKGENPI
ncbi:MAG: hypothetical protein R3F34_10095 [Planctomycetota bacterium]